MAFKLAEAFIEFKSQGLNSVAAQMATATKQAGTATSAVNMLDSALSRVGAGMKVPKIGVSGTQGQTAPSGQLPPIVPPSSKADAIEQRLRAAIATLNRLQASKAAGGIVLDIDLSKARGAVGGLTASLARVTGKSVADINQQFGVTASQATAAKPPVDRLAKAVSSIKPPTAPSGGFFSAITSGASSAIGMMTSFKGMLAGAGIAAGVFSAVNMVGQAEQTSVAFEVMLGSASKAKQMLGDLRQFADVSPFTFPGVADASKTLLQFGVAARDVVPTIKRIGDVAAGDEQKMQSLALVYGQVASNNKLMGQDLNQMINAGFNPLQEISRTTGESMATLRKRMEDGGISAQEVAKAFETATSQGGKFFGMTERMSGTTLGLLSTLKDNAMSAVRNMTEPFMPAVNTLIKGAGQVIAGIGSMLAPSFSIIGREVSAFFGSIGFEFNTASLGQSLADITTRVIGTFRSIYDAVAPTVRSTVGFITSTWQRIGPSLGAIAGSVLDSIGPVIEFLAPMIPTVLELTAAFLTASAVPAVFTAVGATIAAIASPVGIAVAAIGGLTLWLNSGSDTANAFKAVVNSVFSRVGSFIAETIDLVGFAFRNWGTLLDLAVAHAGLFVDNTMARFSAFGQNVANLATWVADNWQNMFIDLGTSITTILTNIGRNIGEFVFNLQRALAGEEVDLQFVGITDGIEFATKQLPKLVAPGIKQTTAEIDGLYRKLGESEAAYAARKQSAEKKQLDPDKPPEPDAPPPPPDAPPEKGGQASFLGFDMLAKRMGADSPMVQEQKKTNSILSARDSVYKANAANETMQTIPDDWAKKSGISKEESILSAQEIIGRANAAGVALPDDWAKKAGGTQASNTEEVKGTLQEQLAVFSQAVTALQSLVDMASNKGIKTQGGEAVFA